MADAFISYAHADRSLVQPILDALTVHDRSFLMDDELLPMTNWWEEIQRFIEQSTAFVFMLSPRSLQSEICLRELAYAAKVRKRLIVIWLDDDGKVLDGVKESEAGAYFNSDQQWIDFRDPRVFDDKLNALLFALDNDIVYWKQSTNILEEARDWETHDCDRGRLLRGKRLSEAQRILEESFEKDVRPADALVRFVSASRRSARARQRWGVGFLSTGLILVTAVSLLSLNLYRISVNQRNQALRDGNAALLSVYSQTALQNHQLDLALLLALKANQTNDTMQTRQALLNSLEDSPHLESYVRPHAAQVMSVAVSADSSFLLLGGQDGSLVEHDLATGNETPFPEAVMEHGTAPVGGILVSPDGTRAITYSSHSDGFLVWNIQTRTLQARLPANTDQLATWSVTSDGQYLTAGVCAQEAIIDPNTGVGVCAEYAIQQWNLVTGKPEKDVHLPGATVTGLGADHIPLAISPDGALAIVQVETLQRLDGTTVPASAAFPGVGDLVQSGNYQLWSVTTGQPATDAIPFGDPKIPGSLIARFSPDGASLLLIHACGSVDGSGGRSYQSNCLPALEVFAVHGRNLENGVVYSTDVLMQGSGLSAYAPLDGAEYGEDGAIYLINGSAIFKIVPAPSSSLPTIQSTDLAGTHEQTINRLILFPDGKHYALWLNSGATPGQPDLELFSLGKSDQLTSQTPLPVTDKWATPAQLLGYRFDVGGGYWRTSAGDAYWPLVSSDGKNMVGVPDDVGDHTDIPIYDNTTGQSPYSIKLAPGETAFVSDYSGNDMALASDNNTLVVATNKHVFIWDIARRQVLKQFAVKNLMQVRISPDRAVVTGVVFNGNTAQLTTIDTASGKVTSIQVNNTQAKIEDTALSSAGDRMATITADGTITFWDARTLKQLATLSAFDSPGAQESSVAFSPDGKLLASIGPASVTLWTVDSDSLYAHFANVLSGGDSDVVWTTEGDRLLWSGSSQMNAISVGLGYWRSLACTLANRNLTHAEWKQYVGQAAYAPVCSRVPAS